MIKTEPQGEGVIQCGKNQQNLAGANKGNGKVVISLVNPHKKDNTKITIEWYL